MSNDSAPHCLICEEEITSETDSLEHIIPNAIGGRKKVSGFLCLSCNSVTGDKWDVELARQMNPLSLFFRITRERGDAPSQTFPTVSGGEWALNPDGSLSLPDPKFEKTETDSGTEIHISARSMEEAEKMLKGVARKHPQLDVDSLLERAELNSIYEKEPIKFSLQFGGLDAGRSFVKTALALVFKAGADIRTCEHAIQFLKEDSAEACFGYYYERDMVTNRPEGTPIHCVHVNGDPDYGIIRGYLEYFGAVRVVMCLSSTYSGPGFSETYAIDPTRGEELDLEVDLTLTKDDIRRAYGYEKWDGHAVEEAWGAVIGPTIAAQHEAEKERILNEAVQYAFDNCGASEGEELTEEQTNRLVGLMWEKLEPWILSQLVSRNERD